LTAGTCDAPVKQPLAPRVPEVTHRELPNGRGFLRVVDGGKASPKAPTPIAPTPAPIAVAAPVIDATGQLDLLSYRPKPRKPEQLSLFPDEK
jgi:hypothetical protein